MPDLAERLADARPHALPSFSRERAERVREAIERSRHAPNRRGVIAGGVLAAGLVAALVLVFGLTRRPAPEVSESAPPAAVAAAPEKTLFKLEDGSSVRPRSENAQVHPVVVSATGVTLRLESGSAEFSVTPNPERPFEVLARDVSVTVLGTVFGVALEGTGVRVAVTEGRVRVRSPLQTRELGAGEEALFVHSPDPSESAEVGVPAAGRDGAATPSGPSWRTLAQDGDYPAALSRLVAQGPSSVRDTPGDLLLAADVSRLGGEPERAVTLLRRVVTHHSKDSRAPLAAFTLGRTLLDQLGRPREAAQAFVTARKLAPQGALAQDCLAREVESWSRAGETERARERAQAYLGLYPSGRRAASVKRYGGLE